MRSHGSKGGPAVIHCIMDQDIHQGSGNLQLGSNSAMSMPINPMELKNPPRPFWKFG